MIKSLPHEVKDKLMPGVMRMEENDTVNCIQDLHNPKRKIFKVKLCK